MPPKYIITEQSVGSRFIKFIYKMIADGKTAALKEKMASDKELQEIISDIDSVHKKLTAHLAKHKVEMKDSGYYSGE